MGRNSITVWLVGREGPIRIDSRDLGLAVDGNLAFVSALNRMMTPNDQSRANAEIRDLIENWATSIRNLDINGAVVNHAEDMLMFDVPPPVHIRGIDGYRQTWPSFF